MTYHPQFKQLQPLVPVYMNTGPAEPQFHKIVWIKFTVDMVFTYCYTLGRSRLLMEITQYIMFIPEVF